MAITAVKGAMSALNVTMLANPIGIVITKKGQKYRFENKDIVKGSGYITRQCCGNTEIELGTVYAAEMGISLFTDINRYSLEDGTITLMDYCYTEYPNIVKNGGYNGYKKPVIAEKKTVAQLAKEVIYGKWVNGEERQQRLTDAGYDYDKVQERVNELMKE